VELRGEIDQFCEGIQTLFATIPHAIFLNDREAYYHTVIYLVLSLIDVNLACEIQTNQDRIDAVLETSDRFYNTEFKIGTAKESLAQIQTKGYADASTFLIISIDSRQKSRTPIRASARPIHRLNSVSITWWPCQLRRPNSAAHRRPGIGVFG
jgi:hypothetical protein